MTQTEQNLAKLTAEHNAIKDYKQKSAFYDTHLYPAIRDNFIAETEDTPPIEVLILPVSNQYLPVLSAARWKPKVALLIYSSISKRHQKFIEEQIMSLDLDIECIHREVLNIELDPIRLYEAIKQDIKPYLRINELNNHIALDITGGTKVMSVGAAMAVSLVGGQFFYVLTSTTQDDIQQREVGTEQARKLADPYTTLGDIQRQRAFSFYKSHDYSTSQVLFAELANRVDPPQGDLAWAKLASAYAAWDSFNLEKAEQYLSQIVEIADLPENLGEARPKLQEQIQLIQRVRSLLETRRPDREDRTTWKEERSYSKAVDTFVPQQIKKLIQNQIAPSLLAIFYTNALRRQEQQRLDTAALLLYRCLEFMSQHRLAREGVLAEFPRDGIETLEQKHTNLEQRYGKEIRKVWPNDRFGVPRKKITLFNGYILLRAINDDFAIRCDMSKIQEQIDIRNQSILAHGFNFISDRDYRQFKATVDEVIQYWCDVEKIQWETYSTICTFLQIRT